MSRHDAVGIAGGVETMSSNTMQSAAPGMNDVKDKTIVSIFYALK